MFCLTTTPCGLLPVLTLQSCDVIVLVGVDAELDESSVDDVEQTEDVIVSQWREVSGDERRQMREQIDEIVRPFGLQTELVVLSRANSIALYFLCMTLLALDSLRDQWNNGQLREIVQSLFTFLSRSTRQVRVKRLSWPLNDYERCLKFFQSLQGKQTN